MSAKAAAAPNWPALTVKLKPTSSLVPYARNAKLHSPAQVRLIAELMRKFGWTMACLADEKGELIAGHGRILAAALNVEEFGLKDFENAPVASAVGWTDAEKAAYRIADNKTTMMGGWDENMLRVEFEALQVADFSIELTAFAPVELGELGVPGYAIDAEKAKAVEVVPPVPKKPVLKPGEIWTLGRHRLIVGDSTRSDDVERLLAGEKAALCLCDPPYGIGYEYRTHSDKPRQNAALVSSAFHLAPAGKCWTPGGMNLRRDLDRFGAAKMLVWSKRFAAAGNGLGGANTFEPILVIDPPARHLANDVLEFMTDREQVDGQSLRELHPCPKPVALFRALAAAFTDAGHAIYDPFLGSGTTLIAAEMEDRSCFGVEIDPAYCELVITRWQTLTGKTATREDGKGLGDLRKKTRRK